MNARGRACRADPGTSGTAPLGDRLPERGTGWQEGPEPHALRPLARAIVDLALALDHEGGEE